MQIQIKIKCTLPEQTQLKQNIKSTDNDTAINCKVINKPDDMTAGEWVLSMVEWEVTQ